MPTEPTPCGSCGAPLGATFDTSVVKCAYCGKTQPNPRPLPEGQEVLLRGGSFGLKLGRVASCSGPDRIEIESDQKRENHRLDDVTPVSALSPEARGGDRVFVDLGAFDWRPTWLVRVEGSICVVKHEDPSFQSDFFDKQIPTSGVRVPMRRKDRERRRGAFWSWRGPPFVVIAAVAGIAWIALHLLGRC